MVFGPNLSQQSPEYDVEVLTTKLHCSVCIRCEQRRIPKNKVLGNVAHSSRLKEIAMNRDIRLFLLLLNDSFTLINTELNDKQLTKCINLRMIVLLPQITCQKLNKLQNLSDSYSVVHDLLKTL
jgi:hypothetical protein